MNTYSYHLCNSATPHGKNNNQQLNKTRINKEKLTQNKLSFLLNNSTIKLRINKIFIIQPDPPVKFSFQKKNKQRKKMAQKSLEAIPNDTISASTNWTNWGDVLSRNFEEITIDIVLNVASTMSGYSSDVMLGWTRPQLHGRCCWVLSKVEEEEEEEETQQGFGNRKQKSK